MASLSEGRFQLPDANTAVSRVTAPVDTTVASSIKAFGDLGGQARQGHLEGQLLNNLQETGDIINTINAGTDAIRDAVRKKQIDPTSKRFQALAAATTQGKISQGRASIEAEVLLRESISKAPGFADQFRATAREVLGFDPSSASLNSLFLSGPDTGKTQPLTEEQKDLQKAQAMFNGGAVASVEDGFKLIQQDRADKLREGITGARIQKGQLNAGKVAVEGANRATSAFNGVMQGAFAQIATVGGIDDIEVFKAAILSSSDIVKSKIENEMAASEDFSYTPEHFNQVRQRIDEQREAYIEILDNQDLTNVLAKNRDRLADLVEIAGVSLAPDLAILSNLGEPAQQAYMDLMVLSGGDPRLMQELMAADPRKAFVGGLIMQARDIAPSFKAMADGNLGALVAEGRIDQQTAAAVAVDQANAVVDGKPTAVDIGKVFEGLSDTEMPKTGLDMVAKTAGRSFMEMSEPQRAKVSQQHSSVSAQQFREVNLALQNATVQGLQLSFRGGKFVIVDPQGRPSADLIGFTQPPSGNADADDQFISSALGNELDVADTLRYINGSLVPIMQDQRWAATAGFANGQEWAEGMINKINLSSLAPEVAQGGPILESMGIQDQVAFRKAWSDGDINKAITLMSGVAKSGVGEAEVGGFRTQVNQAGIAQPLIRDGKGQPVDPGSAPQEVSPDETTLGFEGFRPTVYTDPAGFQTIGYGHNLEANPLTSEFKARIGIDPATPDEQITLSPEQAQELYSDDIKEVIPEVVKLVPDFKILRRGAQKTIIDLGFNVGTESLAGFKKMLKALKGNPPDYDKAADELLDSHYGRGWVRGPNGRVIQNEDGTNRVFAGLVRRAEFNAKRLRGG
jgi:lysozyme